MFKGVEAQTNENENTLFRSVFANRVIMLETA